MQASNQFIYDGSTYSFGVLPPFEAVKVELIVVKAIGEPLFRSLSESKKSGKKDNVLDILAEVSSAETPPDGVETPPERAKVLTEAVASTGAAIGLITSRLDYEEVSELLRTVYKYVSVNGKRVIVEQDFLGKNKALWIVLFAALRFNFADFFGGGLSPLAKR